MIEPGENLPLLEEPADRTIIPDAPSPQQLERNRLLVLVVGAFGEEYGAHAAAAELADDAVRADRRARDGFVGIGWELAQDRHGKFRRGSIQKGRRVGVRQKRCDGGTQLGCSLAGLFDVGGPLVGSQLERAVDDFEDLPPPRGQSCTRGSRASHSGRSQDASRAGAAQSPTARVAAAGAKKEGSLERLALPAARFHRILDLPE